MNALFAHTTSALVALATPEAIAELARRGRDAQGLKAGYTAKCIREGVKPAYWGEKPAKARKAREPKGVMGAMLHALKTDPAMQPPETRAAFAYAKPELPKALAAVTKPKRDTLAAVRRDMAERIEGCEHAILKLTSAMKSTHESVEVLSRMVRDQLARA